MIKLLNKHRKWRDFINIKEPEVYISVMLTVITLLVLGYINVRGEFCTFSATIQNILLYLVAGMIGLIGISLSGVAIITGLFSGKDVALIEKINGNEVFERLMSSFLLLAMSCAIYVFWAFILILLVDSSLPVVGVKLFWAISFVTTYFAIFNILYTVSLVGNCIKIFAIRNKYNEIPEKSFYDIANEFRIDYILKGITDKYNISEEEFLTDLEDIVIRSDVKGKEEIIDYYYRYYTGKKKI